jgi:hypothetical protein
MYLNFIGGGAVELLLILFVSVFIFLLPVIALIDILKSKFDGNDKIVWVLVVLFLPILGSVLYFIIGKKSH